MKRKYTDFLVVGSGSGGMTAAMAAFDTGMETMVIEKSTYWGGSSAMSGGGIWIPSSPVLRRHGVHSEIEDIVTYLTEVTNGSVDTKKLRMFAEKGDEMMQYIEANAPYLQFRYCKGYSDYHPEYPCGRAEGRSIECLPFNLKKLDDSSGEIQPSDITPPMGMYITSSEFHDMSMVMRTWRGKYVATKVMARTVANWFTGRKMVALGQSLMSRLRMELQERGVEVLCDTPMRELVVQDGAVVGVIALHEGQPTEFFARKGVLLASGGFEHSHILRQQHLPEGAKENNSAGSDYNVGDGIVASKAVQAATEYMDDAWWMPSVRLPNGKLFTLVSERAIPRSIVVNQEGRRFTNEASPYVNFVHDQLQSESVSAWHVLDAKALSRYMYAANPPGMPLPKQWFASGMVVKAKTIAELADAISVPKETLESTVAQYNTAVKNGETDEFKKGESAYDRYYGDPTLPNPVCDVIDKPPYYAFRLEIGDIGTKGGIKTNEYGQAIDENDRVIAGLYATGNTAGSVMGRDYAGAGATIAPSMVFGYVAAQHAAKND